VFDSIGLGGAPGLGVGLNELVGCEKGNNAPCEWGKDDARCGALLSSEMNAVGCLHGHDMRLDRCTNLL